MSKRGAPKEPEEEDSEGAEWDDESHELGNTAAFLSGPRAHERNEQKQRKLNVCRQENILDCLHVTHVFSILRVVEAYLAEEEGVAGAHLDYGQKGGGRGNR